MKCVRDEIRTHTAARPLPPQSSVSTNSTTRTSINLWSEISKKIRAKNGTRTRDPNLGKVVLYQLSYFRNSNLFSKTDVFHCSLWAKNGTRTRDPNLGKVVLYQLSYFRNCSAKVGIIFELTNISRSFFCKKLRFPLPKINNKVSINTLSPRKNSKKFHLFSKDFLSHFKYSIH